MGERRARAPPRAGVRSDPRTSRPALAPAARGSLPSRVCLAPRRGAGLPRALPRVGGLRRAAAASPSRERRRARVARSRCSRRRSPALSGVAARPVPVVRRAAPEDARRRRRVARPARPRAGLSPAARGRRGPPHTTGEAHVRALDAAGGALRALVVAIATSERAEPALLARLRERGLSHLDVRFYVLRHVKRLAKPAGLPPRRGRPQRLGELLMCVRPPARDVAPADASFVGAGGDVAGAPRLPASARRLLSAARHRVAFCASWRAVLALPLPPSTMRSVLPWLPEAVFPHVPRPARYCDLLNGNADPEKEAPACARVHAGTPTDTPSPQCCTLTRRRLRARRRAGDARASRAVRPHDAPRPRVPALLPASVRAHHPVRAQRHAPSCLHRSPANAALATHGRTPGNAPILLPCALSPRPRLLPPSRHRSSSPPAASQTISSPRLPSAWGGSRLRSGANGCSVGYVYNLPLRTGCAHPHSPPGRRGHCGAACPEAAASSDTFVESEDDPAACRDRAPAISRLAALAHVPDGRLGRLALLCPNDAEYPARRPARTRTGRGAAS